VSVESWVACRLAGGEASLLLDRLCALWVESAPRFGAVAAHFREEWWARWFEAGFWGWLAFPLDARCSAAVELAGPAGQLEVVPDGSWHAGLVVDRGLPAFWSPELPEVRPTQALGWTGVWIVTDESKRTGGYVWRGARA